MRLPLKSIALTVGLLLWVFAPDRPTPLALNGLTAQAQTPPDLKVEAVGEALHEANRLPQADPFSPATAQSISLMMAQASPTNELDKAIAKGIRLAQEGSEASLMAAIDQFEQALQLSRAGDQSTQRALALVWLGFIHNALGEKTTALAFYNQALPLYRAVSDRGGEATTLNNIGFIHNALGEKTTALAFYNQALPLYRAVGDRGGEATTLNNIGLVYYALGEQPKAMEYYTQALPLWQAVGDRASEAATLINIGAVYDALGEKQKALEYYTQALPLYRAVGNSPEERLRQRAGEATTLNNIGGVYAALGEKQKALEFFNQALPLRRAVGDRAGEAKTLNHIGRVYDALGEKQKALGFFNQALPLRRAVGDRAGEATTLNNIGLVYSDLGEQQKALEYYTQTLPLSRAVGDRVGEATTLNNIGGVYADLGEQQKALEYYTQALPLRRAVGDRAGEAATLNNIGRVYSDLGKQQKALEFFNQALPLRRAVGDRAGEAATLNNIGRVYSDLGKQQKALEFFNQALPLSRAVGDRAGEATTLNNIGFVYSDLGEQQKALEYCTQALPLYRAVGDREGEARTLNNVGYVIAAQKQPQLAIVFFKQSVSTYESLRADIRQLPKATQESYTKTVASTYRQLADLLLQQDRILEAQQVLDLLKVQELEDYLRNTRSTTDQALTIRPPEAEILKRYGDLQATAIQLGTERAQLNQLNTKTTLTPTQQQRLDDLIQLEKELNQKFNQFIADPTIQALLKQLTADTKNQNVNLDALNGLRDDLKTLNAVSLYPLILDDRIELILTTPNTPPLRRPVSVKKADLIPVITAYRDALRRPGNLAETQKLAQQLYDWLIKPIEPELNQAKPQTILYAPDGALRYIPLAALYDGTQPTGKRWLTQRYQIQNITARSLITNFTTPRKPNLQIFAAAFGNQTRTVTVGTNRFNFGSIPFTLTEVANLGQLFPNSRILTEQAFSQAATLRQLDSFNVIHLATHGKFVVGEAKNSFILLGNGDTITLPQIQDLSLANVDLIVLSACETGVGDTLGSGTEILGLGYQFQLAGAKAAIASLWQVDDGGTQALMNVFYKALKAQKTKTEALQIAQQAMIRGEYQALGIGRSDIEVQSTRTRQPIPADQLRHPYYWAPFILIGNGL
jgi:CHAT domain-containing protein/Tfp pilus assembly protein PilF